VEDILAKDGMFAMPGKKVLKRKSGSIQYIEVDVIAFHLNPEFNQFKRS
jgi:hypothetical protein